ncbi:hypothetical protein ACQPZ2_19100 [Nocardia pseudovaccinii]
MNEADHIAADDRSAAADITIRLALRVVEVSLPPTTCARPLGRAA